MAKLGTIALVAVLLGLLVAAIWLAVHTWMAAAGSPMPAVGYVAMTFGVVLSLLVGIALMALLFYSSRHGYDDQASEQPRPSDDNRD
jgi:hypothetical protein